VAQLVLQEQRDHRFILNDEDAAVAKFH
jgi:hypothetical protein